MSEIVIEGFVCPEPSKTLVLRRKTAKNGTDGTKNVMNVDPISKTAGSSMKKR